MPLVFTEHGVLMLSSVLNSDQAVSVNIQIVRVFARLRATLIDASDLKLAVSELKGLTNNHSECIKVIFKWLDKLSPKGLDEGRTLIGFKTTG